MRMLKPAATIQYFAEPLCFLLKAARVYLLVRYYKKLPPAVLIYTEIL